jgi:hypothetical protein
MKSRNGALPVIWRLPILEPLPARQHSARCKSVVTMQGFAMLAKVASDMVRYQSTDCTLSVHVAAKMKTR